MESFSLGFDRNHRIQDMNPRILITMGPSPNKVPTLLKALFSQISLLLPFKHVLKKIYTLSKLVNSKVYVYKFIEKNKSNSSLTCPKSKA